MGLGKTIQLLAFLQHLKAEEELKRPVLLVAPTSVLTNWKREAAAFTPDLTVNEHYGPRRPSSAEALKNCLLYTSPSPRDGLLSRMPSSA